MKYFTLLAVALLGTGCCAPDLAEKATFDVLEPAHRAYVTQDPNLTEADKARRFRLLDAWKAKVEAEHAGGSN